MKNIQVIDGALNCTYDIYAVSDDVFGLIFPEKGQDIEFSEDAFARLGDDVATPLFASIWKGKISRRSVNGIHGTLFFGLAHKHEFYPSKRETDLDNLHFRDGRFQSKTGTQ
jgi:hypothetical protein